MVFGERIIVIPAHLLLEATALRVRAIQNGEIAPVAMVLPPQPFDVLRHDHRLLLVTVGWLQLQAFSVFVLTIYVLWNLPFVAPDQRVSRLHDQLRRTVVLFQFKTRESIYLFDGETEAVI